MKILLIGDKKEINFFISIIKNSRRRGVTIFTSSGNEKIEGVKMIAHSKIEGDKLAEFANNYQIDLAIVNSFEAVAVGVCDKLIETNINTIGPTKEVLWFAGPEGARVWGEIGLNSHHDWLWKHKEYRFPFLINCNGSYLFLQADKLNREQAEEKFALSLIQTLCDRRLAYNGIIVYEMKFSPLQNLWLIHAEVLFSEYYLARLVAALATDPLLFLDNMGKGNIRNSGCIFKTV